jgi:phage terminase small subunit
MAKELRDIEKRFVDEYMIDMDAKNAAIRAGYSPTTANTASEWIKLPNPQKPRVRAKIDEAMAARSRRTGITADRVLMELAKVAFADIADIADLETGEIQPDIRKADTSAIASIKIKQTPTTTEREIRMSDRTRALELLGKHLGMFADNVNINAAAPVITDDIKGAAADG